MRARAAVGRLDANSENSQNICVPDNSSYDAISAQMYAAEPAATARGVNVVGLAVGVAVGAAALLAAAAAALLLCRSRRKRAQAQAEESKRQFRGSHVRARPTQRAFVKGDFQGFVCKAAPARPVPVAAAVAPGGRACCGSRGGALRCVCGRWRRQVTARRPLVRAPAPCVMRRPWQQRTLWGGRRARACARNLRAR